MAQAKALCNATVGEPDVGRCAVLASQIGELLSRYDTPSIAMLFGAALTLTAELKVHPGHKQALQTRIDDLERQYGALLNQS